ncbi:MAG: hypothetical protein ACR2ON_00780 [Paracoccaceae bacterium]
MNDNFVNNYIAPHTDEYTLDIIDKTINEIILTYKNKNINKLIEIMNDFPLNRYSRKLVGDEIYLWEA